MLNIYKNITKDKYFLLFFLFMIALFVSQTVMDIFITLITLVFLFNIKSFNFNSKPIKYFLILSLLFMVNVCVGFLLNNPPASHAIKRILEATWPLTVLSFCFLFEKIEFSYEKIKALCSIPIFMVIASLIFHYGTHRNILIPGRFGGSYLDPMTFAHVCGLFASFIFYFMLISLFDKTSDLKNLKLVLPITFFLLTLSILLTETRGVWLSLLAIVFLLTFYFSKKWFTTAFLALSALFILLYYSWDNFKNRIDITMSKKDPSILTRFELWKANWEMFKDHPLFGVGWGSNNSLLLEYYKKLNINSDFVSHAHNQILNILSGTGSIGLILFLSFFIFFLWIFKKSYSSKNKLIQYTSVSLVAVQLNFLISGLTEANFERARVRYVLLMAWGLALFIERLRNKEIQKT